MKTDVQDERSKPQERVRPSHHTVLMRGVVTPIFGLLAVACIVFGILNATIWKPNRQVSAVADVRNTQYLVVDPGVLDLVDNHVTLDVDGGEEPCIAIGSAKDVSGWLAGHPYVRITGMETWQTLSTVDEQAQGTPSDSKEQVAFKDSDMWHEVQCGTGSAQVELADAQGDDVALVDLGQTAADATVDLHWTRQSIPDFALPWYFAGGLSAILAILCASVFAMEPHRRRRTQDATAPDPAAADGKADGGQEVTIGEALAGSLHKLKPTKRSKDHRRHGRHGAAAGHDRPEPTVVDPAARNLVEEHAQHAGADAADHGDVQATAVITDDELQAYFARLAKEEGPVEASTSQELTVTTPTASTDLVPVEVPGPDREPEPDQDPVEDGDDNAAEGGKEQAQ